MTPIGQSDAQIGLVQLPATRAGERSSFTIVAAADDLWPPTREIIGQRAPAAMHIKLQSGDNQPVPVVVP